MRISPLIFVCLLLLCATAHAQVYVPKEGEIQFKVLQTTKDKPLQQIRTSSFTHHPYSAMKSIDLDTAEPSHEYFGCGVSMTDASCWILSQMEPEARHELLKDAFSSSGMNLSMVRLNCGASDYSTELYTYNDTPGDIGMKYFSIARDEVYMIPMVKQIYTFCPELFVYSSIWSAPGWMKDSGAMCGGSLLDEYMSAFANYWVSYLDAYRRAGVKIDAFTVQNEPETDQEGYNPATFVSAKQEIELAGKLLPAALKKKGLDTDIWIWDHNYDGWQRVLEVLADRNVRKNISAVAWHPYAGSPSMMKGVTQEYPDIDMHLTERGPNQAMEDVQDPKWFADVIFDALNNGCSSYSSWNLVLDSDGQPCTGRFACGGLIEVDLESGNVKKSHQYTVFRQFSPYVKRGAQVMNIEQPEKDITAITFLNPDGEYVICIAAGNKSKMRQRVQIKFQNQYLGLSLPLDTWSLTTVIIDAVESSI